MRNTGFKPRGMEREGENELHRERRDRRREERKPKRTGKKRFTERKKKGWELRGWGRPSLTTPWGLKKGRQEFREWQKKKVKETKVCGGLQEGGRIKPLPGKS